MHGAVVIAIDPPFALRGGGFAESGPRDRTNQIGLTTDPQRAVDVLRSRPNVDSDRIAFLAFGYGAATGAQFVGIGRRLEAGVLVVGEGGLLTHFAGPEDVSTMSSKSCATRVDWFRATVPIEPIRFIPNASPTAPYTAPAAAIGVISRPCSATSHTVHSCSNVLA